MQKHSFWNSPKSLSRNEINKDRRLSLNCSKSRTCTIFTMPVLFPKKNYNFTWCVSFFREYRLHKFQKIDGEKPSKYFFSTAKQQRKSNLIENLVDGEGRVINQTENMLDYV